MVSIIIPQAFRIVIPPLTNELVLLFKDSSLVLFLGVTLEERELTKFGRDLASQTANSTPILVAGPVLPAGDRAARLRGAPPGGRKAR